MKEILKKLCIDKGVSGNENEMLDVIKELVGDFAGDGKGLGVSAEGESGGICCKEIVGH